MRTGTATRPCLTPNTNPPHPLSPPPRTPPPSLQDDEAVEPEVLDVVCRVCEDCWASDRLEEHNELCTVLQQVTRIGGRKAA